MFSLLFLDSAAEENIAMAIESDYSVEAYMIANVFDEQIKPYIKLCIEKPQTVQTIGLIRKLKLMESHAPQLYALIV